MSVEDACCLFHRCLAGRRDGDWRLLIDLYDSKIRVLVRFAAARCAMSLAGPDLDEAVQDLYTRLLAVPSNSFAGRSEAELWSFLGQMARNLLVDRRRAWTARKRWPRVSEVGTGQLASRHRPGFDPEERLLAKERRDHFLQRCLEIVRCDRVLLELQVLRLALLDGWTSREIARHLQDRLAPQQVDQLVSRLRRHLARDGIYLPRRLGAAMVSSGA